MLWGTKVSSGTISNLNQKAYKHIEEWRQRPVTGEYPYVYVDGIYLKRCWGGKIQKISVLVAIGVNKDGFREILGAAEGMKEDSMACVPCEMLIKNHLSFLKCIPHRPKRKPCLFQLNQNRQGFLAEI